MVKPTTSWENPLRLSSASPTQLSLICVETATQAGAPDAGGFGGKQNAATSNAEVLFPGNRGLASTPNGPSDAPNPRRSMDKESVPGVHNLMGYSFH